MSEDRASSPPAPSPSGAGEEVGAHALTAKGQRTRAHIVRTAADLLHERGVAATTLLDVRRAARVSSSQLYHYFVDKQALVRAVADHQVSTVVGHQRDVDLSSVPALRAWADDVVREDAARHGRGGCPLGSLGADLAETDPAGREQVADGFTRWAAAIEAGLVRMRERGDLPAGTDTRARALAVLAALQGGLLLSQVQRDSEPLRAALDGAVDLLEALTGHGPSGAARATVHRDG